MSKFSQEIESLAASLSELASVPSRAAREASGSIATLIDQEFAGEHDAYGAPWAEHTAGTVRRWGTHPIHDLTGDERKGVDVKPMAGAGISVTFDTEYSGFAQEGTAFEVARPVLPDGELPRSWESAIERACEHSAQRIMGGRK